MTVLWLTFSLVAVAGMFATRSLTGARGQRQQASSVVAPLPLGRPHRARPHQRPALPAASTRERPALPAASTRERPALPATSTRERPALPATSARKALNPRPEPDRQQELRTALEQDQLVLHYQPEVSLASGEVVGLEALVRWRHPVEGLLSPAAFIATAEHSDLIIPLGRWVLREACAALSRLRRHHPGLRMSVNVSSRQLEEDPGWVDEVVAVVAATGIAPAALTLEVTETAVMQDLAGGRAALAALRHAGVRIALDDFGTGYSSLAYLADLPASVLKLDRHFVGNLDHSRPHRHVVSWIAELAARLDITVTAEGIETGHQALLLQSLGYRTGQGFLYSRPLAEDAVVEYLAGHQGTSRGVSSARAA